MALPTNTSKETRMDFAVRLTDVVGEVGHSQWWMDGFSTFDGTAVRSRDRFSTADTVPLYFFILSNRLHMFFMKSSHLFLLPLCPDFRHCAHNTSTTADRVGTRFVLWFFLLANRADLVQIAFEDLGVGDILAGFGELEKNNAGADDEEAHDDVDDLDGGAMEALEEHRGSDNGAASEVDVVGWCYQGGVEEVECFLFGES